MVLLRPLPRPGAGHADVDDAVHVIHRGRVITGTVRSRLPACVEGLSWYEPGVVPHAAEALAAVAEVATRCVPWARVYLGPRIFSATETADVVDRAAARGQPRPGQYLDSAVERRARLYECWASAWDEGWRPVAVLGRPLRRVDRVCAYVRSGRLARDVARGRNVLPRLGPVCLACRWVVAAVSHPAAGAAIPAVVALSIWYRR